MQYPRFLSSLQNLTFSSHPETNLFLSEAKVLSLKEGSVHHNRGDLLKETYFKAENARCLTKLHENIRAGRQLRKNDSVGTYNWLDILYFIWNCILIDTYSISGMKIIGQWNSQNAASSMCVMEFAHKWEFRCDGWIALYDNIKSDFQQIQSVWFIS